MKSREKVFRGDGMSWRWKNNRMEGEGVFEWPDGRIYNGEYVNDKKEGYGKYFWPNRKNYKGMWRDGEKQNEARRAIKTR